ncbi:hypothetical protein KJ980_00570 [Patescibacteria group bacterium]|nr:hypothetical protein [Patescibacteria group bacterium]MBU4017269.1 hypothetical protein [Patescibacteria group bacterium]MBU4098122.1 hypothetical protein [Patescibacteria group bacterium]
MKKFTTIIFTLFFFLILLVPQAKAAVLVTQQTVSSGDSWTVNYNNGQVFEFDMNYSGQWPVLTCKNSSSGSVGVWFQTNEVNVKTSAGFSQRLGGIYAVATNHYKLVCDNDSVAVYYNDGLLGKATDNSINAPSGNFINQPRVDFIANGYTRMNNFIIYDSNPPVADTTPPVITINSPSGTVTTQTVPIDVSITDESGVASSKYFVDGIEIPNTSISINLTYYQPGDHTFKVEAMDTKSNSGSETSSFTYSPTTTSMREGISQMYEDGKITKLGSSLYDKLDQAQTYINSSDYNSARDKLNALINQIKAQIDVHITVEAGNLLIVQIQYLMDSLLQ